MPTAIEKIQAKAKALRKSYPNAKWTDLIKKASTDLKKIGAIGGVSKKKKATKKAATKKTVAKRKTKIVKVLKQHGTSAKAYDKRHQALPAGRRISKSGKPYTETRSNRSDKGVLLGVRKTFKKLDVNEFRGLSTGAKKLWIDIGKKSYFKFNTPINILNFLYDEYLIKGQYKKCEYIKELINWHG